ncbi:hypothetical protein SAMN06265355_102612 [Actinomadura mexicana]|uniref:Uncharacterized protein n=1 Tax=Actinomadura mexicana TaxID=134959 RepID=A0A238W3G0_9ACTN|nr:hypothetical protein SAMN06265355_102612 [Actinomadura mexicana]
MDRKLGELFGGAFEVAFEQVGYSGADADLSPERRGDGCASCPCGVGHLGGLEGSVRVACSSGHCQREEGAALGGKDQTERSVGQSWMVSADCSARLTRTVKGLRIDHISERMTARLPAGDEPRLLQIKKSEPVLSSVS